MQSAVPKFEADAMPDGGRVEAPMTVEGARRAFAGQAAALDAERMEAGAPARAIVQALDR